jgi:hypothetical protein
LEVVPNHTNILLHACDIGILEGLKVNHIPSEAPSTNKLVPAKMSRKVNRSMRNPRSKSPLPWFLSSQSL